LLIASNNGLFALEPPILRRSSEIESYAVMPRISATSHTLFLKVLFEVSPPLPSIMDDQKNTPLSAA
jgi:hypothetical protein